MNNLVIIEHKHIRVLTTQQIAEAYGTDTQIITNNFNRNKDRYTEGKHYICLIGEEKSEFINKNQNDFSSFARAKAIYLWTKQGAFLHAKSLNTDVAWEVYERLVDSYFDNQEKKTNLENLSPELQMFIKMGEAMARQELEQKRQAEQIEEVQKRVESIREVVALDTTSWRNETGNLLKKIGLELGGGQAFSQVRSESYELLSKRMGANLKQRLTNKRRRMADEGVCKSARDKLSYVDIIAEDKKLIEGYTAIVKEMAIKYGI